MVQWNSTRTKVQLRLAVQRLRMVQQKQEALAKKARRDIATLVEKGKLETARVRVENIINEDIHSELLELLELYCELLVARFGLLDMNTREPDPGVKEGICSIIHAAPRTEIKELHVLREMLMSKYGREFSIGVMDNKDNCVSERVTRKLQVATPSPALVDAYLGEIAKGYGIDWSPSPPPNNAVASPASPKAESIALEADEPEAKAILSPAKFKDSETKLPDVPAGGASEPPPSYPAAAASTSKSHEEDLFKRLENLKRR
ncbi:regulator of Vps4 activity in the MVB pathway protein [Rhizoctonia solani AG-3 Rhs1AP]|uniref:Regulator of Vps4 activity in the MVB pathway protein n=1 Tax=Rhizoctonia solani AG-3 Rhs1AP TaxID=1086054 RepID=X8J5X2_9AGAM|nr:regulator of Vps4 activity in the MVB pathway protein [Rhizoctonia solani AG-3 Rhs1AP]